MWDSKFNGFERFKNNLKTSRLVFYNKTFFESTYNEAIILKTLEHQQHNKRSLKIQKKNFKICNVFIRENC